MNRRNLFKVIGLGCFSPAVISVDEALPIRRVPARTRHRKVYEGGGVTFYCGDKVFSQKPDPYWNMSVKSCRHCGMDWSSHGRNPETDCIIEGNTGPARA